MRLIYRCSQACRHHVDGQACNAADGLDVTTRVGQGLPAIDNMRDDCACWVESDVDTLRMIADKVRDSSGGAWQSSEHSRARIRRLCFERGLAFDSDSLRDIMGLLLDGLESLEKA